MFCFFRCYCLLPRQAWAVSYISEEGTILAEYKGRDVSLNRKSMCYQCLLFLMDYRHWAECIKPNLATHMLVFMVMGICSSLKSPYAQFLMKAASGDTLHPIVWRCVEHLEGIGLKVLCFVCDSASSNRKFYQMHSTDKSLTHQVKNVYSDEDSPLSLTFPTS